MAGTFNIVRYGEPKSQQSTHVLYCLATVPGWPEEAVRSEMTGVIVVSPLCDAGYNEVVRIPSGATNIDVRQHSYSGKPEDDNYLGKIQTQDRLHFDPV